MCVHIRRHEASSQALLRQDREVSSRCQDFVPHEVKTYHARSVADGAVAEMALNRFANIGPQFRQRISLSKDVVPERSCRIAAIGFVFMDFKHYFSRHGAVVPIMGATGIEPCRVKKVLLNSFSCQKKALARNSMRGSRNAACGVKPRARKAAGHRLESRLTLLPPPPPLLPDFVDHAAAGAAATGVAAIVGRADELALLAGKKAGAWVGRRRCL